MGVNFLCAASLALACWAASVAHAQVGGASVYKWVDAQGVTHYADKPALASQGPIQERSIGKDALGAGDDFGAQRRLAQASRDGAQGKREADEAAKAAARAQEESKQRAKACESAREASRALASGARVATVNDKGERVFLEDGQIAQRALDAQKLQEQSCSAPKAP